MGTDKRAAFNKQGQNMQRQQGKFNKLGQNQQNQEGQQSHKGQRNWASAKSKQGKKKGGRA